MIAKDLGNWIASKRSKTYELFLIFCLEVKNPLFPEHTKVMGNTKGISALV